MGIWEALTELVDLAKPWAEAEAEAPAKDEQDKVCRVPGLEPAQKPRRRGVLAAN